jgi:NADH-quinone oxidoreductase subunit J
VAEILFYTLGVLALLFALGVVLAKSPMMSVLSLLGTFFCLSIIYLLAGFQFLAAAQVLVYAGAILVLFLFVIMLLNLSHLSYAEVAPSFLKSKAARWSTTLAIAVALIGLVAAQANVTSDRPIEVQPHGIDTLNGLATELFGRYSLPFEAISILLLATMVAVIVLAKRQRGNTGPRARIGEKA